MPAALRCGLVRSRLDLPRVLAQMSRSEGSPIIYSKQDGGCTQGQSLLVAAAQCGAARQQVGHSPAGAVYNCAGLACYHLFCAPVRGKPTTA